MKISSKRLLGVCIDLSILFPDGRLRELISVSEDMARHLDPLRTYLADHLPFPGTKVFTVYAWAIIGEVAAFARIIPIHADRSYYKVSDARVSRPS